MLCINCGFNVNELMRYALRQNVCPSCGEALFSNRDNSLINMVQSKLSSERFASKLTEELVYDISLFIFNELKYGSLREELRAEDNNNSDLEYQEELSDEELIKREVEKEYMEELAQLDDSGDIISEEYLEKAQRLKRLREQQLKNNPNSGKEVPIRMAGKTGKRVNRIN